MHSYELCLRLVQSSFELLHRSITAASAVTFKNNLEWKCCLNFSDQTEIIKWYFGFGRSFCCSSLNQLILFITKGHPASNALQLSSLTDFFFSFIWTIMFICFSCLYVLSYKIHSTNFYTEYVVNIELFNKYRVVSH